MCKIWTKILPITVIINVLLSSILLLQIKELRNNFIILHDDFNLVIPKFSNDIWEINKKIKK